MFKFMAIWHTDILEWSANSFSWDVYMKLALKIVNWLKMCCYWCCGIKERKFETEKIKWERSAVKW